MRIITLAAILYFFALEGFAQTASSPLLGSFEEFRKARSQSLVHPEWIPLGPALNSALAESVQIHPGNPAIMYLAFGSGNLWKTTNMGQSWKAIFEDQAALGIGDLAMSASNPDILYLATGESLKKDRNFTMPGTGVYRSDDGGESWTHAGLADSWHIGELAIHPTNPNIVFAAVMGKFWTASQNKGIYKTTDGGKTWKQVLYVDQNTRANDIVISPTDPNILYATMWENLPDTTLAESVYGPNSGIYRSSDGGESWQKCTEGLPSGPRLGRSGVAVSYTNPNKIYALIDNLNLERDKSAEVYRSLDGGIHWSKTHTDTLRFFATLGWYFADIYVNPQDDDEIYTLGIRMARSSDGGKNFELVGGQVRHLNPSPAQTLHLDHCELWIHPEKGDFLALVNDGGLYVSHDKGLNWLHYNNIPAGEFYTITTDNQDPYRIFGGVQDDATVYGTAKEYDPRFPDPWKYLWIDSWSGGDGCVTQVDPEEPNTVYFSMQEGAILRKDLSADTSVGIRPRLPRAMNEELRFHFVTPYFISSYDSKTLYHAGNFVFKTTDRGDHWNVISPDLTRSEIPSKSSRAVGAIAESRISKGLLYVGTDRGGFWTSKDDGASWTEHSNGLPDYYIRSIAPSRHKESRVYLSMTGINYDELGAYLFVSENYGRTWQSIRGNLPNEIVNVLFEDPLHEEILYAGTYRGVFVSFDRGMSWQHLGESFPVAAVSDLIIQEQKHDLIAATHGRGIYMLNLDPVYAYFKSGYGHSQNQLFSVPAAHLPKRRDTHRDFDLATAEKISISFYLKEASEAKLFAIDGEGNELWSKSIAGKKGFQQFRWDLVAKRHESDLPYFVHYDEYIPEGEYRLILEIGEERLEQPLIVRKQGY